MTNDDLRKQIAKAKYFRDAEGTLKIIEVRKDVFFVEDKDGEVYEVFYNDYVDDKQTFQILS